MAWDECMTLCMTGWCLKNWPFHHFHPKARDSTPAFYGPQTMIFFRGETGGDWITLRWPRLQNGHIFLPFLFTGFQCDGVTTWCKRHLLKRWSGRKEEASHKPMMWPSPTKESYIFYIFLLSPLSTASSGVLWSVKKPRFCILMSSRICHIPSGYLTVRHGKIHPFLRTVNPMVMTNSTPWYRWP